MNDDRNLTEVCTGRNDIDDDGNDDDSDDDSNNHCKYYNHTIEAIKTKTGLDIGYKVLWPKRNFCIHQPPESESCSSNQPPNGNALIHNDDHDECVIVAVKQQQSTCDEQHLSDNIQKTNCDDKDNDDDDDDIDHDEYVVLELSTQLPSDCIAPMFHGTQWAGTTIWRSAVVALQYLLYYNNNSNSNSSFDKSCSNDSKLAVTSSSKSSSGGCSGIQLDETMTLLELGCGLGVPGMVLHAMTGCRTILTDKSDLLLQLQRNIQSNFYNSEKNNDYDSNHDLSHDKRKIEAHALDWSIDGLHELLERCPNSSSSTTIHFILSCDCIYEPLYGDSWRNLLNIQNELLRLFPLAYVLTACHRRPSDGIDSYIIEANQQQYVSHTEQLCIPFAHSSVVELYRLHGKT